MVEELTPLAQAGVSDCGMEISILFFRKTQFSQNLLPLSEQIPVWVNSTAQNFKVNVRWINSQF